MAADERSPRSSTRRAILVPFAVFAGTLARAADDPVCLEREDCRQAVLWQGKDGAGRAVKLLEATFDRTPGLPWCDIPAEEIRADPSQLLLVTSEPGGPVTLVIQLCNNGYGVSMVGEDGLLVHADELTLSRNGGSGDRWGESYTWSLPGLELVATSRAGYWAASIGEWENEEQWDHRTLVGVVATTVSAAAAGQPDAGEGFTAHALLVPSIPAPDGFDLARHGPGDCAAVVDSSGERGYVIHGPPSGADDARLRVVLLGGGGVFPFAQAGELVVEVEDDVWVDAARNPLHADHLELWMTSVPSSRYDREEGYAAADAAMAQWSIAMNDGKTALLLGEHSPALAAEVVQSGERLRRVRIPLPPCGDACTFTLVYSDSDDGKGQERLIATSELVRGRSYSLGSTHEATCTLGAEGLANARPRGVPWDGKPVTP